LNENEIKAIHTQFMANNPDGKLNRIEFQNLYHQFRAHPYQDLGAITELTFQEFDRDHSFKKDFDKKI